MRLTSFAFAAFAALVASSLVACTDGGGSESVEDTQLEQARQKFTTNVPGSYSYERTQSCECTAEFGAAIRIQVDDDEITSAVYVETEDSVPAEIRAHLYTMEGVFALIQDAADDGLPYEVTYDTELGYPKAVFIDRIPEAADDEIALTITNFDRQITTQCGVVGSSKPCGVQ